MSRAAELDAMLEKYPDGRRENLVAILQEVQHRHGYLSAEALTHIGERLRLPVSKVYGIASFYDQFRFQPKGRIHCQVCRGAGCHVKGSAAVFEAVKRTLKLEPGRTSRDGKYSLEVVTCMGACGLSPAMSINGECYGNVTPSSVGTLIRQYEQGTEVGPHDDAGR